MVAAVVHNIFFFLSSPLLFNKVAIHQNYEEKNTII